MSKPTGPETSFTLVGPNECAGLGCLFPQPQEQFEVKLYARSDIETANLFKADITFPKDLVEVTEIKEEGFIKNWVENFYDNETGEIDLTGGVTAPGYQTQQGGESALMVTIVFKAKTLGKGTVSLTDSSAIYSNLNNINILTIKRNYDVSVEVASTPTPIPVPSFGKAVKLDGSSSCVRINENPDNISPALDFSKPDATRNFTVEGWFKLESTTELGDYRLYSTLRSPGWNPSIDIYTRNGKLNFNLATYAGFNNDSYSAYATGKTVLNPAEWYHFAAIREGNNVRLLLNGNEDATVSLSASGMSVKASRLTIGCQEIFTGSSVVFGSYLKGEVDGIRVSNIARYSSTYSVPAKPFSLDDNTLALWNFDGNISDSQGNRTTSTGNIQFVDSTIIQDPSTIFSCDVNSDGVKDTKDGELITGGWNKPGTGICAKVDIDKDGTITTGDIQKFAYNCPEIFPAPSPAPGQKGDGNKDGKINLIDMSVLHTDWQGSDNIKKNIRTGIDMNDDGLINSFDYRDLRQLLQDLGVVKVKAK